MQACATKVQANFCQTNYASPVLKYRCVNWSRCQNLSVEYLAHARNSSAISRHLLGRAICLSIVSEPMVRWCLLPVYARHLAEKIPLLAMSLSYLIRGAIQLPSTPQCLDRLHWYRALAVRHKRVLLTVLTGFSDTPPPFL